LGGHSLKATILTSRIHKELNVRCPWRKYLKQTIAGIGKIYKGSWGKISLPLIEPVEKKEYYALSSAQKRLYISSKMDPSIGTAYNMPEFIPLPGARKLKNWNIHLNN
jgi:hypothetical protein